MLSKRSLERAQGVAGIHAPVRFDPETGSTNITAMRLAERGAPEWTLVGAGRQTEGRGRLGRRWETPRKGALLFSLVLRPKLEPAQAALITLLSGAAMARACRETIGAEVRCKWPNDLLLGDAKVGGILTEARVSGSSLLFVVVGVGVNAGEAPPRVEGAAGLGADAETLLGSFLHVFRDAYHPEGAGFSREVLAMYRPLSATLGRPVTISRRDGRHLEGIAVELDAWGALVVETEGSRTRVTSGEVLHARPRTGDEGGGVPREAPD